MYGTALVPGPPPALGRDRWASEPFDRHAKSSRVSGMRSISVAVAVIRSSPGPAPAGSSPDGGSGGRSDLPSAFHGPVHVLRIGLALLVAAGPAAAGAPPHLRWSWPVATPHPIVRPYVAPMSPYGAGHRGVDVRAPVGALVTAPEGGRVRFAGRVVDRGVLSIDHGGVLSSFEPVRALVRAGGAVARGQPVAVVTEPGRTHPAGVLHIGARTTEGYVSPLLLLGGLRRAVLLPLGEG